MHEFPTHILDDKDHKDRLRPSRVHGHSPASNSSHVSAGSFFLSGKRMPSTPPSLSPPGSMTSHQSLRRHHAHRAVKEGPFSSDFRALKVWTCLKMSIEIPQVPSHFPKLMWCDVLLFTKILSRKNAPRVVKHRGSSTTDPSASSLWPESSQLFFLLLIPCSLHLDPRNLGPKHRLPGSFFRRCRIKWGYS